MDLSPRDQFLNCSQLSARVFEAATAGLEVSFHFPGDPSGEFLQLPDGTDGESLHGGYAAWQAQLRATPAGDPSVITTFLDGSLEVAEYFSPFEDGPYAFRAEEHVHRFAAFYAEGLAEAGVGVEDFTEAVVNAAKAAIERREARYAPCDLCLEAYPAEQLEDAACCHCASTWLDPGPA